MSIISKLISYENTSLKASFSKKFTISKQNHTKTPVLNSDISLIKTISLLLEKIYDISPQIKGKDLFKRSFCIYDCLSMPSLSIEDYLKRIQTYLKCTDEMILLSLVYVDKLIQKTGSLITSQNIHKYFNRKKYNNFVLICFV